MTKLLWSPAASLVPTERGLALRSDLGTFLLEGDDAAVFATKLVPLLDGTRDEAAVAAALPAYSAASVGRLLSLLRDRGLVDERGLEEREPSWSGERAFLRATRGSAARASSGKALLVVVTGRDDAGEIERISRLAHEAKVATLWSHLEGHTAILGPLVTPGETACRVCAGQGPFAPAALQGSAGGEPADPLDPAIFAELVALEALRILAGPDPSELGGRLRVEDLRAHTSTRYTLVRIPWCPVCGSGAR